MGVSMETGDVRARSLTSGKGYRLRTKLVRAVQGAGPQGLGETKQITREEFYVIIG